MSRKRARSASPDTLGSVQTFRSAPVKDRSSTFLAAFSPTVSAKSLQHLPDFEKATHRISAWRKRGRQRTLSSSQPSVLESGYDDDGEKYAGKKLERVLSETNTEGAVVVARWYGGVLLGPVRFDHIENCAREAISKWKLASTNAEGDDPRTRKRRMEQDEENKSKLVLALEQRDQSISVLRKLLVEKSQMKSAEEVGKRPVADLDGQPVPQKLDYPKMPLLVLKQLEKARDNTISWILREIEKAETRQKSLQNNVLEPSDSSEVLKSGTEGKVESIIINNCPR